MSLIRSGQFHSWSWDLKDRSDTCLCLSNATADKYHLCILQLQHVYRGTRVRVRRGPLPAQCDLAGVHDPTHRHRDRDFHTHRRHNQGQNRHHRGRHLPGRRGDHHLLRHGVPALHTSATQDQEHQQQLEWRCDGDADIGCFLVQPRRLSESCPTGRLVLSSEFGLSYIYCKSEGWHSPPSTGSVTFLVG